jgi:hypothetical protein
VHVRAHRGRREELAHAPLRIVPRVLPDDADRYFRMMRTVIADDADRYYGKGVLGCEHRTVRQARCAVRAYLRGTYGSTSAAGSARSILFSKTTVAQSS